MIFDQLKNASLYFGLGDRFVKAFQYLQSTGKDIEPGKYEIQGEEIYALAQNYVTGDRKDQLEAHRRYADIHYMISGIEGVGFANVDHLEAGAYDQVADYAPMRGEATFITLHEGFFVIFYPQDAHMPGLSRGNPQRVKKIVVKVLVDDIP